jgi:hypothetical protein
LHCFNFYPLFKGQPLHQNYGKGRTKKWQIGTKI